jgi:hypothetical protein
LGRQARFTTARARQLVGPGIVTVPGGLGTIRRRHLAVVDGLGSVVRGPGEPRNRLVTLIRRVLTVGCRAIPRGSVKIARGVITRFGLSVAQPGRDVTVLRSEAGLPAAHSCQLVGPGVFAILGGVGTIFGRYLAVIDGLGTVVRSLSATRGRSGAFDCLLLALARRAVTCGPVEITRRVITRRGLSVTLLGLSVTHVRGQIAIAPLDVTLARLCQGVLTFIRSTRVLIWESHAAGPSIGHISRPWRRRAPKLLQHQPAARTIAAT